MFFTNRPDWNGVDPSWRGLKSVIALARKIPRGKTWIKASSRPRYSALEPARQIHVARLKLRTHPNQATAPFVLVSFTNHIGTTKTSHKKIVLQTYPNHAIVR